MVTAASEILEMVIIYQGEILIIQVYKDKHLIIIVTISEDEVNIIILHPTIITTLEIIIIILKY